MINKFQQRFLLIFVFVISNLLMDTVISRLKYAIKFLSERGEPMDGKDIASKLGYKRAQSVTDIINGEDDPPPKFVVAFCLAYLVNESWLKTGVGAMIGDLHRKENFQSIKAVEVELPNKEKILINISVENKSDTHPATDPKTLSKLIYAREKHTGVEVGEAARKSGLKESELKAVESGTSGAIPIAYLEFLLGNQIDLNSIFDQSEQVRLITPVKIVDKKKSGQ